MIILLFLSLIALILPLLILFTVMLLSKKTMKDREKLSPFECGFDLFSSARSPFSLRFFIITIIFLIFDVEVAIFMPLPLLFSSSSPDQLLLTSTVILIILLLGLLHEWLHGALEWTL